VAAYPEGTADGQASCFLNHDRFHRALANTYASFVTYRWIKVPLLSLDAGRSGFPLFNVVPDQS
jgi:hypothetical protein